MRRRVVIIGGGFAGINAAHGLRRLPVDVTLVDRNNFHTFQPLLYQVSTAYLPAEEVGAALRSVFRRQSNLDLRVGEVMGVAWENQELRLADGRSLPFDYLVVAGGGTTNFFGIPGLENHAWPLYTLDDAVRLRTHLLEQLEVAASHTNVEDSTIHSTVVVVGGGPTGVETAGALATMGKELIGEELELRVVLIEALPRLLNQFSERSSRRALDDLRRRGIEVRLGARLETVEEDVVKFADGERLETSTVIWAAGIKANPLGAMLGLPVTDTGAVAVERSLQVIGHANVFAAGDIAEIQGAPNAIPNLAPAAIQGGKHIAKEIGADIDGRTPKSFKYLDKGMMAVLGRGNAVAELPFGNRKGPFAFGGFMAWLLWLGIHIVYLIGFRNRIKVLVDWGWNYLSSRGSGAILMSRDRRTQ